MAVRYVLTELRQGLRRNISMHLAVVITLLVSMTLAGVGYLLLQQAQQADRDLGGKLQITVYMCTGVPEGRTKNCLEEVTPQQKALIQSTLSHNPYVSGVSYESPQDLYKTWQREKLAGVTGPNPVVTVDAAPASFRISMSDAHHVQAIIDSVLTLPGVMRVNDQRDLVARILGVLDATMGMALAAAGALLVGALLLVSNTVRLAAFARRREISIMRLVGASSLYIMLPFLLEVLVAALVGAGLAVAALAGTVYFGVQKGLAPHIQFMSWVGWHDWAIGSFYVVGLSVLLSVVPALLMTRRYVKV